MSGIKCTTRDLEDQFGAVNLDNKEMNDIKEYKGLHQHIKELEDIIKMLKWEYKVDMSKEEVQSIIDGRDYDRERIKELEDAIKEAIEIRKAMPFYASGIRIDLNVVASTIDRMYDVLQKALSVAKENK